MSKNNGPDEGSQLTPRNSRTKAQIDRELKFGDSRIAAGLLANHGMKTVEESAGARGAERSSLEETLKALISVSEHENIDDGDGI